MSRFLIPFALMTMLSCTQNAPTEDVQEAKDESENVLDPHAGHQHDLETFYTCSMHPEIRESKPGKCPICNMMLTKVELEEADDTVPSSMAMMDEGMSAGEAIAKIKLRKSQLSHFDPAYFPVSTMKMTKEVRLLGTILQSEDKQSAIPARVGGRVEKVYIKSTGSFVKQGDPVLKIYSPQLITAGQEYIVSRKSFEENQKEDFKQLLVKAQERLEYWGIKQWQYESWYKGGKVPEQVILYSPSTGIVQKHSAKVGRYFKEGQNFFELSDLSEVWVELDVYEHDSSIVKLGQRVNLEFSSSPGNPIEGELDFINPVLDIKSRTLKVRATIPNVNGELKPGMIAEASLTVVFDGDPLVVPRTAIINTGKRKVVWIGIDDARFEARLVHTGFESEGYVEIKSGLSEGDRVVMDGNFLLDAQAQLFGGYSDAVSQASNSHQH